MWLIRNILVSVDLSDASEFALDRAVDIASQLGARVTAIHVTETQPGGPVAHAFEAMIAARKNRGIDIQAALRRGKAAKAVMEMADDRIAIDRRIGGHLRRARREEDRQTRASRTTEGRGHLLRQAGG